VSGGEGDPLTLSRFVPIARLRLFAAAFIVCGILAAVAVLSLSPRYHTAHAQSSVIEGSQHPENIPDEFAYRAVFRTLMPDGQPSELNQREIAGTLRKIKLGPDDRSTLIAIVAAYAAELRNVQDEVNQNSPDKEALHARRAAALFNAIAASNATLSQDGRVKLAVYVQGEKKHIKLFPLPDMNAHGHAHLFWQRLFGPTTVYAQSMSPYGSTYSNQSIPDDDSGTINGSSTTDASSSCFCHQSSASTSLVLPSGTSTNAGGGGLSSEIDTARDQLVLGPNDFVDGNIVASGVHNSYCPIIGQMFLVNGESSDVNPLQVIQAYYKCDTGGLCGTNQPGTVTYHRCNLFNRCDTLVTGITPKPLFALITVAQINIGIAYICVSRKDNVQPVDQCYSPDPKP